MKIKFNTIGYYIRKSLSREGRREFRSFKNFTKLPVVFLFGIVAMGTQACSSEADGNGTDKSPSASSDDSTFQGVEGLCGALDHDTYAEYVGIEPELLNESEDISEGIGTMHCWFGNDGKESDIIDHGIEVRAQTYSTLEQTEENYSKGLGLTDSDLNDMDVVEGPWDEARSLTVQGTQTYLLVARADNLTIGVVQTVEPMEALDSADAMELMTGYAESVISEMRTL